MLTAAPSIIINSSVFDEQRKIEVFLPNIYYQGATVGNKYMVAILFDAQAPGFLDFCRATIGQLIDQGQLQPLILIGISATNRQYEFTPKATTATGKRSFKRSGGANILARHLKEEVLPLIKKNYRCNGYHIGIGHSLGGTFVTYCMIKYKALFDAIIAISPNLNYDREQIIRRFDKLGANASLDHKFIYLAYGHSDVIEERFKVSTETLAQRFIDKNPVGLRWELARLDNDLHGLTAMEGIFKGLYALNRQFTLSPEQLQHFKKNTEHSFLTQVKDYFKTAADRSQLELPTAYQLNNLGYTCYYNGWTKEAIQLFYYGLAMYPHNINLYDSIGEIYQLNGDVKAASKFYNKGLRKVKKQLADIESQTASKLINNFKKRLKSLDQIT